MNKDQITSFIEDQLALGNITRADLVEIVKATPFEINGPDGRPPMFTAPVATPPIDDSPVIAAAPAEAHASSRGLINAFYAIGAIIAVVGVSILVGQHWNDICFAGRILVSLGIALISYLAAIILNKPEQKTVSQVLFTVSAALGPLGAYVLLDQAGVTFDSSVQLMTAVILGLIFGTALWISRRPVLTIITIAYGTWAYFALIDRAFSPHYWWDNDLYKWAVIILGIAYLLIAYGLRIANASAEKEKAAVKSMLYGAGTLAVLGASITIGGIFDIVMIALIFAAFYGSVYLRSRAMLLLAGFFLMAHLVKLTSKYFVDSIGWPVALILVGFLIIGVGYGTFYVNKTYLKKAQA